MAKLTELRKAANLTLQQLADRAGLHIRSVQKLESGERRLITAEASTVLALARALGITMEELLDDESAED